MDGPDSGLEYEKAYEIFSLFTVSNLKQYLSKRGWSTKGTKDVLLSKAVCAWTRKDTIVPSVADEFITKTQDYQAVLVTPNGVLPDPNKLSTGWQNEANGMKNWPSIFITDMSHFLMRTHPDGKDFTHRLLNEYKEGKAYRYYCSGWLKEVLFHPVDSSSQYCYLKAKCTPSQRVNDPYHDVWICAKKISCVECQIQSAYCSCANGLSSTCNHVAAVLFRVEAAVRQGLTKPASTSLPCSWMIPQKKTTIQPKRVADVNFKLQKYGKEESRPLVSTKKRLYSALKEENTMNTEERRQRLQNQLKKVIPDACMFPPSPKDDSESHLEAASLLMMDLATTFQGDKSQFIEQLPTYSSETIRKVEQQTVDQSGNTLWTDLRKGRITASNFYAVKTKIETLEKQPDSDTTRLTEVILGQDSTPDLPQFKYGRAIEKRALTRYIKHLEKSGHRDILVKPSGLFLDGTAAFLAASPDFLVSCCCGDGLMECKAMYALRDSDISNHTPQFLNRIDGALTLKENHPYFAQVQGQMALTDRLWCDLFVCTNVSEVVLRVAFTENYWNDLRRSLTLFFSTVIVPHMLDLVKNQHKENVMPELSDTDQCISDSAKKRDVTDDIQLNQGNSECDKVAYTCPICAVVCLENVRSFKDSSIGCDKCEKWHHFKCVGINSRKQAIVIEQGEWLCPMC